MPSFPGFPLGQGKSENLLEGQENQRFLLQSQGKVREEYFVNLESSFTFFVTFLLFH